VFAFHRVKDIQKIIPAGRKKSFLFLRDFLLPVYIFSEKRNHTTKKTEFQVIVEDDACLFFVV